MRYTSHVLMLGALSLGVARPVFAGAANGHREKLSFPAQSTVVSGLSRTGFYVAPGLVKTLPASALKGLRLELAAAQKHAQEPFSLALLPHLPSSAGSLRDYTLALQAHPSVVGKVGILTVVTPAEAYTATDVLPPSLLDRLNSNSHRASARGIVLMAKTQIQVVAAAVSESMAFSRSMYQQMRNGSGPVPGSASKDMPAGASIPSLPPSFGSRAIGALLLMGIAAAFLRLQSHKKGALPPAPMFSARVTQQPAAPLRHKLEALDQLIAYAPESPSRSKAVAMRESAIVMLSSVDDSPHEIDATPLPPERIAETERLLDEACGLMRQTALKKSRDIS